MGSELPAAVLARHLVDPLLARVATRLALRDRVGEARLGQRIVRLDEATRKRTFELEGSPGKWAPEADLIACAHAIWEGPARRDRALYNKFLQRQVNLGTGRVQRALISLASPKRILDRAPSIWSSEHSHGTLTVEHHSDTSASLRLSEHPYVETPQARATIAEVFRYVLSLTRANEANESHALEGDVLRVRLTWK